MRRVSVTVLIVMFAALGLIASNAIAKEKKAKAAGGGKEARWSGLIVRSDKDGSTLTVGKRGTEKIIHYDSSTKWTKGTSTVDMGEFKDGDRVICLGKYNEKGEFMATRVDKRAPH